MPKDSKDSKTTFRKPPLKTLVEYAANYPTLGKVLLPAFYASTKSSKILQEVLEEPKKYFSSAGWHYSERVTTEGLTYIRVKWRYFDKEFIHTSAGKMQPKERKEALLRCFINTKGWKMIAKGRDELGISPDW